MNETRFVHPVTEGAVEVFEDHIAIATQLAGGKMLLRIRTKENADAMIDALTSAREDVWGERELGEVRDA